LPSNPLAMAISFDVMFLARPAERAVVSPHVE
jgi:hypothetical protein